MDGSAKKDHKERVVYWGEGGVRMRRGEGAETEGSGSTDLEVLDVRAPFLY